MLEERKNQLERDIENYEHMLEEAADLEKSWNKDATDLKGIRYINLIMNEFDCI